MHSALPVVAAAVADRNLVSVAAVAAAGHTCQVAVGCIHQAVVAAAKEAAAAVAAAVARSLPSAAGQDMHQSADQHQL